MTYLLLFYEFFKTGLFSVGGGMATIPFLYDMADQYPWFTRQDLADMIAISESTPGAFGVNMATYAGYRADGILGSLVATFALVLPSILVILIVARFLKQFRENRFVNGAFDTLRPVVAGIIAAICLDLLKIAVLRPELFLQTWQVADLFQWPNLLLFAIMLLLVFRWKKHPVVYIGIGAFAGIVFGL